MDSILRRMLIRIINLIIRILLISTVARINIREGNFQFSVLLLYIYVDNINVNYNNRSQSQQNSYTLEKKKSMDQKIITNNYLINQMSYGQIDDIKIKTTIGIKKSNSIKKPIKYLQNNQKNNFTKIFEDNRKVKQSKSKNQNYFSKMKKRQVSQDGQKNSTQTNNYSLNSIQSQEEIKRTFQMYYSYRTKQGVHSAKPTKTNQDAFIIIPKLFDDRNIKFFAVCDGHGAYGHLVSEFVRAQVNIYLKKDQQILQNPIQALRNMISKIVQSLKKSDIDCNFSGTTFAGLLFVYGIVYSINIGDSRAIQGSFANNQIWEEELTEDHKPSQENECKRIIQNNGRVKAQENNEEGPKRVWLKDQNYPGLAMSRSIGDYVAESVGVIFEPEIKKFEVTNGAYVIATDGVWEFLSSKQVIQMLETYIKEDDVESASEDILQRAYTEWASEDNSYVDDITLITIFCKERKNRTNVSTII